MWRHWREATWVSSFLYYFFFFGHNSLHSWDGFHVSQMECLQQVPQMLLVTAQVSSSTGVLDYCFPCPASWHLLIRTQKDDCLLSGWAVLSAGLCLRLPTAFVFACSAHICSIAGYSAHSESLCWACVQRSQSQQPFVYLSSSTCGAWLSCVYIPLQAFSDDFFYSLLDSDSPDCLKHMIQTMGLFAALINH